MPFTRSRARPPAADNGSGPRAGSAIVFLLPILAMVAVVAIWQLTDLHDFDAERFAEVARKLRESPAGLAYTVLVFSVGTLLFLPVTPLVMATFFAFGPLRGFIYAALGALAAAAVTYGAGRLLGGAAVERVSGPRLAKLAQELRANAFRAGILMRILPVGHFTVINLLAGSLRIPFGWYLLGNTLGIALSLMFVALFADRLLEALRSPDTLSIALAAGCLLLLGVLAFVARYVLRRRARRLDDA